MHATQTRKRTARSLRNEQLGIRPRRSEHTVLLRRAEFDQVMESEGYKTNLEVAHFLDLGEGTVSRLRSGESKPGTGVIAAIVKKLPKLPLRRVFDFGDDDMPAAA
ncbi:hypothetical protein ACFFX1_54605 [Dactylosporangium sucinum]|uniref:Uncharacterized protein n=1 Tax=Dactylosporangium sucinum TaxID=1424081 RepID=A0A917X8K0_9ACTN|nr:hypothetical protein [Dactylosporangium sucinum]GGM90721.1 hypothetical protein GCM10007977_110920 [Dactylosporangium sucinum]